MSLIPLATNLQKVVCGATTGEFALVLQFANQLFQ